MQRRLPIYETKLGMLFKGDCLDILPMIQTDTVDLAFADPPFNLGKHYGPATGDVLAERQYLDWCHAWLGQCVRVLKPGGALFVYNLPKWNIFLAGFLLTTRQDMQFRHWIAVEQNNRLPIPGRLYPSHYSLLYFTKGKPATFRRIRVPIQTCRHCGREVKDYGGHRPKMNPKGVNLKDVWTDIPPVRHWKFKSKDRLANALSTKLVGRVIEMASQPGDLILDCFGGSGTTYAVCEQKNRRWIGIEIDSTDQIIHRLGTGDVQAHASADVVED
jgi:site-specific DNA-methyltransferase (adenine-specific)